MYVGEVEREMRIALQEPHFHQEWFEVVELIHEVIDGFCKPQNHISLLKIVQDGVTIPDSVGVYHYMIG